jgi:hypothetical protein
VAQVELVRLDLLPYLSCSVRGSDSSFIPVALLLFYAVGIPSSPVEDLVWFNGFYIFDLGYE